MHDNCISHEQAQMLTALANKSWLKVIDQLGKGECPVGELTELIGLDPSTVSKHLALFPGHGIPFDRQEDNFVHNGLITLLCAQLFFLHAPAVKGALMRSAFF